MRKVTRNFIQQGGKHEEEQPRNLGRKIRSGIRAERWFWHKKGRRCAGIGQERESFVGDCVHRYATRRHYGAAGRAPFERTPGARSGARAAGMDDVPGSATTEEAGRVLCRI